MTTDTTTTMTETMTRAQLESILIQPVTERWLAEQLGVAIPTIHRWSNGHEPIPPAVPSEISRVLDTLSDELAATARLVRGEYGSLTFETEWRGVRYTSTDTSPKFLSERLESVVNGRLETGETITVTAAPPGALCTRCKQPAHGGFRQMLAVKTRSIGNAATVAR